MCKQAIQGEKCLLNIDVNFSEWWSCSTPFLSYPPPPSPTPPHPTDIRRVCVEQERGVSREESFLHHSILLWPGSQMQVSIPTIYFEHAYTTDAPFQEISWIQEMWNIFQEICHHTFVSCEQNNAHNFEVQEFFTGTGGISKYHFGT